MGMCYSSQNYQPDRPDEYTEDKQFPFVPDGPSPLIAGQVEFVKGISGRFRGLKCVRKTILDDTEIDKENLKRRLAQEARILHSARHCHVIPLIHTYFDNRTDQVRFSIVMDRAETSLSECLKPKNFDNKRPKLEWFGCLIAVIRYIHGLGIRHRDIKPTNILIKKGRVLLADFGISQMGLGKTMPTTNLARNASRTKEYCAPEVDQGRTRGRSADIFSLGAVFLEMCIAYYNPEDFQQLESILKTEQNQSYARNIDKVHELIRCMKLRLEDGTWQQNILCLCMEMLNSNRDQRPSAEVLNLGNQLTCKCGNNASLTKADKLIEACKNGSTNLVRRLLDDGADPNTMGAIHLASDRGSVDTVRVLLQAGTYVDSLNATGQTALHCAARNGFVAVIELLLEKKAHVDAKDENEQTALHGAAAHGHLKIVQILLHAGADIEAEDLDGDKAVNFARRRGHDAVLQFLGSSKTGRLANNGII
ncbi:hypothetical protein PISL3812_09758 [Talaromyces islandicus]|uniref:Protein kinase domain-containing protein n=1 Tax=Talaromyces islandicus TaxID=28573 RepID=A0A0U1MAM8_TALIS|nr:hypothetical protein PISL3812_09758 [Talaromyces islandicus]